MQQEVTPITEVMNTVRRSHKGQKWLYVLSNDQGGIDMLQVESSMAPNNIKKDILSSHIDAIADLFALITANFNCF
jgi:hypothetical protein